MPKITKTNYFRGVIFTHAIYSIMCTIDDIIYQRQRQQYIQYVPQKDTLVPGEGILLHPAQET